MNKFIIPQLRRRLRAFTLIEIAIVISIITLLALGIAQSATYFRTAANKSLCIVVQKQIQDAMRSIENLDNLAEGTGSDGTQSIDSTLFGLTNSFFPVTPSCPTGLAYTMAGTITPVGTPYAVCSYSGTAHVPGTTVTQSW